MESKGNGAFVVRAEVANIKAVYLTPLIDDEPDALKRVAALLKESLLEVGIIVVDDDIDAAVSFEVGRAMATAKFCGSAELLSRCKLGYEVEDGISFFAIGDE